MLEHSNLSSVYSYRRQHRCVRLGPLTNKYGCAFSLWNAILIQRVVFVYSICYSVANPKLLSPFNM